MQIILKLMMMFFCLLSSKSFARQGYESYMLLSGPTFTAGGHRGAGGYVGFTKSPYGEIGLWPGVVAGVLYKDRLVTHVDFMGAVGLRWIVLCGGLGLRTGESKGLVGQITYGITVGPTTAAIRRYATPQGTMKEGLLTINVPIYMF